jgi:SPX domain protein involved in polyphosphate accumulation
VNFPIKIEAEIQKVSQFCKKEYEGFRESLNHIAKRMTQNVDQPILIAQQNTTFLKKELDILVEDIINLERYLGLNAIHLLKVVQRYLLDIIFPK